jgi:hypothetical protein
MTAYFHADSLKTKQEALALLEERKSKKMETIERLQRMMREETDDELKALFKNQFKEAMKSLAALDAEEQVLSYLLMCFCMSQSLSQTTTSSNIPPSAFSSPVANVPSPAHPAPSAAAPSPAQSAPSPAQASPSPMPGGSQ